MAPNTNEKLSATDTHWQRENQFPPMESHWVYEPQSRADPMVESNWSAQKESKGIFVDFLFNFALFLAFLKSYCSLPVCFDFHFCIFMVFVCLFLVGLFFKEKGA